MASDGQNIGRGREREKILSGNPSIKVFKNDFDVDDGCNYKI